MYLARCLNYLFFQLDSTRKKEFYVNACSKRVKQKSKRYSLEFKIEMTCITFIEV